MTNYYSIPTTLGAAKIAAAANIGQTLTITDMAFGDADNIPYLPNSRINENELINEQYRVAIESLTSDDSEANVYITKAVIPAAVGGFEINEIGLFDDDGDLIYLANYPRTFKPIITQGAGGQLIIKIHMMVSPSTALTIVVNPNVITLTQADGDNRYALKTELDNEANIRDAADSDLLNEIINQSNARADGDLSLSIALAAEITNRENADNRKADLLGDQTIPFSVLDGWVSKHAANIGQLSSYISNTISFLPLPKIFGRFENKNGNQIQFFNTNNVASVTRFTGANLAQVWQVFFINDMPSTDYIVVGNVSFGSGYGGRSFEPFDYQLNSFKIQSQWGGDNLNGFSQGDGAIVNFIVF